MVLAIMENSGVKAVIFILVRNSGFRACGSVCTVLGHAKPGRLCFLLKIGLPEHYYSSSKVSAM